MRMLTLPLVVVFVFVGVAASAQTAGLKIVVVEGEGAVNIIQQKTAVAPVVEIRDRNNLPVPGATVTFAIQGGKMATFGGANTLSITTNAAGRAVATGFNPISAGAVHINVTAAFQGQTVAASIVETNVMTAAEAAGASAGASGGGAAAGGGAGGGGLSTGAIVGIVGGVGAAAAGGVVAANSNGGDENDPTRTSITGPCDIDFSPRLITSPFAGGSFTVTITVTPDRRCSEAWTVGNHTNFVTTDKTSGTGSGTLTVTVAPFSPTPSSPARSDNIGIGITFAGATKSGIIEILQPTRVQE